MICLDMQIYFNFNEKENVLFLFFRLRKRIQKLCWREGEKAKTLKYILSHNFLFFPSFPCLGWTEVEIPCSGEAFYSLSFHSVLLPCLQYKWEHPAQPHQLDCSGASRTYRMTPADRTFLGGGRSLGKQAGTFGASRGGLGVWRWPLPAAAGDWLPEYGRYKN